MKIARWVFPRPLPFRLGSKPPRAPFLKGGNEADVALRNEAGLLEFPEQGPVR